jgi:hypothetical protein
MRHAVPAFNCSDARLQSEFTLSPRKPVTIDHIKPTMHDEIKNLFRQAIVASAPHLQLLVGQFVEQHEVWQKVDDSRWRSTFEYRPNISKMFREAKTQIEKASATFCESFPIYHPEYAGMVGFSETQVNWAKSHSHIVQSALRYLWWRHKTFSFADAQVDAVVQEFADFVDSDHVHLRYQSQLLNFKMPADSLAFPNDLTIRRLSEEEVSCFHGGPVSTLGFFRARFGSIHEFVLEGKLDQPKIYGNKRPGGETMQARAKAVLDRAVLALQTFKGGPVGYDCIHFRPVAFCPIGFFNIQGAGDKYVPFGSYAITTGDCELLTAHAQLIFTCSESAMEMACSRLADAENRTRVEDRIVDAVIGMEALLLAGIDDRKTELSFRFSLNYAMLFPKSERQNAFRVARDLYNLRSTIAHGSSLDKCKLLKIAGEKKLSISEAGTRATAALRTIIRHFLTSLPEKGPQYKSPEFWQRAYFGLSEA